MPEGCRLDVAFIYVADKQRQYGDVERAMHKLLAKIQESNAVKNV